MSDDEHAEPLSDLAAEVRERRAKRRATDEAFAEAFEAVETDAIDGEALWAETLEPAEDAGTVRASTPAEADERDVRVVSADRCHSCEYFAAPPEFACVHEGTEILELVENGTFCVADCPMVGDESLADRT